MRDGKNCPFCRRAKNLVSQIQAARLVPKSLMANLLLLLNIKGTLLISSGAVSSCDET